LFNGIIIFFVLSYFVDYVLDNCTECIELCWTAVTVVICISLHKYFAAGRGCKVLRWACLSVCLSEHLHVSKTTCPNFTRFSVHVTCGCGSAYSHSDSREGSMGSILLLIGLKVIPRVEIMMSTTALFFICLVWLKCLMPILC